MNTTKQQVEKSSEVKSRSALLKFFAIVAPLWLSAKFFNGPYMEFIRSYFAAVILIILLGLLFQLIVPKIKAKPVLVAFFVFLSFVEITHYFLPALFSGIHLSIAQTSIIGGTYSVHMIPYYGVGGFIGYFILRACRIKKEN